MGFKLGARNPDMRRNGPNDMGKSDAPWSGDRKGFAKADGGGKSVPGDNWNVRFDAVKQTKAAASWHTKNG